MSPHTLILTVRLLDGRYYGAGDWPPSPFRLFQALVAAAHTGRAVDDAEMSALLWLESRPAPIIAAPKARQASNTTYYVPRNGADAFGGNLARAAQKRDPKFSKPHFFDAGVPLIYLWSVDTGTEHAETITQLADLLYQLGRGVDMAFAVAETLETQEAERRLADYPGTIFWPTSGGSGFRLRCPQAGQSLQSLVSRHAAQLNRLREGNFRQVPPPAFAEVGYGCPPVRFVFDLRCSGADGGFVSQPLASVAALVEILRNQAAERLRAHHADLTERVVIGRGAEEADKPLRIRIIPLPSIGHAQANQDIRRVVVEVPPNCPIPAADIDWAFAGLTLGVDEETGEIAGPVLIPATDPEDMLRHYGIADAKADEARIWRTVTPVALPMARRPGRRDGATRATAEAGAVQAVRQALRHIGYSGQAIVRRIQREPFDTQGQIAAAFQHGRFAANRLYHVDIEFSQPVAGPIVIGDGRYFGLGLFRPVRDIRRDMAVFSISPTHRLTHADRGPFLDAVRRALMALARDASGQVSRLFSGHEPDGAAACSGTHDHVFLAVEDQDGDGFLDRLLLIAPWRVDRTSKVWRERREQFERVSAALATVRAGKLGVFALGGPGPLADDDRIIRRSRTWISATPYVPTRYPKPKDDLRTWLVGDLIRECARRGIPEPHVDIIETRAGLRGRLIATARLGFAVAVSGPLMLGRDSHAGGGLFVADNV